MITNHMERFEHQAAEYKLPVYVTTDYQESDCLF